MLAFFCPCPSQPGDVPRSRLGFKTRRFVASNSPCCHFPCAVFSMSGTNSKWPDGSVCSRLGSKISRKPKVSGDRDSLPLRDFSERVAVLFFPVGPWRLQPFGVPKGGPTGHAGARRPTVQYCEVSRRLLAITTLTVRQKRKAMSPNPPLVHLFICRCPTLIMC